MNMPSVNVSVLTWYHGPWLFATEERVGGASHSIPLLPPYLIPPLNFQKTKERTIETISYCLKTMVYYLYPLPLKKAFVNSMIPLGIDI